MVKAVETAPRTSAAKDTEIRRKNDRFRHESVKTACPKFFMQASGGVTCCHLPGRDLACDDRGACSAEVHRDLANLHHFRRPRCHLNLSMPELPEVETMRRGILKATGATIVDVQLEPCARRPIAIKPSLAVVQKSLIGTKISAIERLGKRVVVRAGDDFHLILEPRMTGLVLVSDPPSREHLRLRIDLAGSVLPSIWYWDRRGLGSIQLYRTAELDAQLLSGKLGPDALAISKDDFSARLKRTSRAIKVALLDQQIVAGVGNLYASEILHLAAIDPKCRANKLTRQQLDLLHDKMLEVLHTAILHEGSTLSDGTYRNALAQAGNYQNMHRVYDREHEPCPTCLSPIQRIVQAQRSTFFCAACQRPSHKNL